MFEIAGFSTVLLIAGIVELIKKMGLKGNFLILVSVGIGVIFGVVFRIHTMYPETQPWIELAYFGIAFGLGASGLYDLAKSFTERN